MSHKNRIRTTPPEDKQNRGWGAIRDDEVMPLREAARRLGWCDKSRRNALRDGLNVIEYGRYQYVRGRDIHDFFDRLGSRLQDPSGKQAD